MSKKKPIVKSTNTFSLVDLFERADQLKKNGSPHEVVSLYESWLLANPSGPKHFAYFNLGVSYSELGDKHSARRSFMDAVSCEDDFLQAHMSLGSLCEAEGDPEGAVQCWRHALGLPSASQPQQREVVRAILNQLGRILENLRRYDQAEEFLTRSLAITTDQPDVIQHLVHLRQRQCKWPALPQLPGVSANKFLRSLSPLGALALFDDPVIQLMVSQNFINRKVNHGFAPLSAGRSYNHKRLRVGYLSGDLCTHAVGLLLGELFESHDRERVETFAFDYSPNDGSAHRARLLSAIEHVYVVGEHSDEVVANLILGHEIDVLVDLQGLSKGLRDGILARRPAPVQVTYLGFIGTTAMPWIDYVITDKFAFTPEMRPFFSELPLMLSSSFLPNDTKRSRPGPTTREAQGLPSMGFVFASFNNSYKITSEVFGGWLEILDRVPGSILWLVDDNPTASENLRAAARDRGLLDRLVLSPRAVPHDYMARLGLADLFLDCFPYNAGSTARDVLFMGTPMLTRSGRTFVSRMAGSILTEAGLPELITNSYEEYIERAVSIAVNPQELAALRAKIQAYLVTGSSAKSMCREFESLLLKAHMRDVQEPASVFCDVADSGSLGLGSSLLVLGSRGKTYPAQVNEKSVRLYQIAYSEETRASVLPPFLVLDNMENPRADWQEYWPIRKFLLEAELDEGSYYGFFSPRFLEKTGLDAMDVIAFISQHSSETDVFTFSPQPDMGAFFLNVFEQNELFDPGFMDASQAYVDHLDLGVKLKDVLMDSRHTVFSNYFVARPRVWREWLKLTEPLFKACESGAPEAIAHSMCGKTSYRGGIERKVFLLERLICLLLATRPDLRVKSYNTFNCAWSATKVSEFRDDAVVSDALKIAMREQGFSHYVSIFASLRSRLGR
jgi:predicted O-linked N-acetylglucosamine transferase (SPINDLY family)